ncbi:hypothetical protein [Gaetbulibacter sp. PBL-D1]|uniref:hypothetical protein n=1 Tax=Gaetbulibacter sp. PBL-D1 TaxID=3422594 RepID=UPI003D2EA04B
MNHKTNVLKKIEVGNPLYNLGLNKLLEEYNSITSDEGLAAFYHKLLSATEGSGLATNLAYAMISFSTNQDVNPLIQYTYGLLQD